MPTSGDVAGLLTLIAMAYGKDLADKLAEVAKELPGAFSKFIAEHPVASDRWDERFNPAP